MNWGQAALKLAACNVQAIRGAAVALKLFDCLAWVVCSSGNLQPVCRIVSLCYQKLALLAPTQQAGGKRPGFEVFTLVACNGVLLHSHEDGHLR